MRPSTTSMHCLSGPASCSDAFVSRLVVPPCRLPKPRRAVSAAACATIDRPTVSPHSDALRRRTEFEAMMKKREADRMRVKERERAGIKWWQGGLPSNMQSVEKRSDLVQVLVEVASTSSLQILNFFTEDCYTCRTLFPKVKAIASLHPDVLFVEVNGSPDEMRPLLEEMGIKSVPYFHFYKNGRVVSQFTASLNPEKLAKLRLEIASHLV